jgi:hypothetical protein
MIVLLRIGQLVSVITVLLVVAFVLGLMAGPNASEPHAVTSSGCGEAADLVASG